MSYETGTATDLEDLYAKLDTFAQTTHGGWSTIYPANPRTADRWFELNKGSLSFSSKYPSVLDATNTISIHQATGSTLQTTAPGAHTADSGNGYNAAVGGTSVNFLTERCVSQIGNGPFPSYHFFADDVTNDYIHVVAEVSTGLFRHFGFGILDKVGDDWVGGEYVYGQNIFQSGSATAVFSSHTGFFDGLGVATLQANQSATIRIASGLPNQSPAVWGVSTGSSSVVGTDTAANVRRQIHGGFRAGIEARGFGNLSGSSSLGHVPMYTIAARYRDPTLTHAYDLGFLPDVRALNIRNFDAAQEVVIGSDTWIVFPWSLKTTAAVVNRSLFSGVAYKKIL